MEMLEKLPPEVLIYVQNVRKYFTTNEETREYFGVDDNEEEFFNTVIEQSRKNFEETGTPELSVSQFEEAKVRSPQTPYMYGVFVSLGDLGLVSLN